MASTMLSIIFHVFLQYGTVCTYTDRAKFFPLTRSFIFLFLLLSLDEDGMFFNLEDPQTHTRNPLIRNEWVHHHASTRHSPTLSMSSLKRVIGTAPIPFISLSRF